MQVLHNIAVTSQVARTITKPTRYIFLNEAIAVSYRELMQRKQLGIETRLYYAMSLAAFYSHEATST